MSAFFSQSEAYEVQKLRAYVALMEDTGMTYPNLYIEAYIVVPNFMVFTLPQAFVGERFVLRLLV
jgi:hypothetical protein